VYGVGRELNLSLYEVEERFTVDQIQLFHYWASRRLRRQMKFDEYAIRIALSGFTGAK